MGQVAVTGQVPEPAPTAVTRPSATSRWEALDGLRGIAVLMVLLLHLGEFGLWSLQGGHLGVHIFFVLSGFLITVLLLREADRARRISLGGFVRRRAVRLVPALAVFALVLIVMSLVGSRLEVEETTSTALYLLTFTANLTKISGDVPVVGWLTSTESVVWEATHSWSLAIEVHFYLLWAATLWLLTRWSWSYRRIAAVAVVGSAAVMIYRSLLAADSDLGWYVYFNTWTRLDAPLVGALAGLAFVAGWTARVPARILAVLGGVGGAGLLFAAAALPDSVNAQPYDLYTVLALAGAAVIVAVVHDGSGALARVLAWRPLCWFGRISYSLYLWHFSVFFLVSRRDGSWPVGVRYVVALGLAVGVGWLSYRFVEQPFLRWKSRRRPEAVAAGGC